MGMMKSVGQMEGDEWKAAEDSRTPRRWRAIINPLPKFLERGCPLPLLVSAQASDQQL
jgi:hypothetical protein